MTGQAPSIILTEEPKHFRANPETATSNHYQTANPEHKWQLKVLENKAKGQHREFRAALAAKGVTVLAVKGRENPDEVFLNNWFSTHDDEDVAVIYPMHDASRRAERREDIINVLKSQYSTVLDLSPHEHKGQFLEGTGSLVLDRVNKVAYAARSERTDEALFRKWAKFLDYKPVMFDAKDKSGKPIYHTNVMMYIGTGVAGICLDAIPQEQRNMVKLALELTGHEIVNLTQEQLGEFAGNAFELQGNDGKVLLLSDRAYKSLTKEQLATFEKYYPNGNIVHPKFSALEKAGGSVRCATAAIYPTKGKESFLADFEKYCTESKRETVASLVR